MIPKLTALLHDDRVETWQQIDDLIVQHRVVLALKAIREAKKRTLARAIDISRERYELLRRTRSDDFTVSAEDYGRGI